MPGPDGIETHFDELREYSEGKGFAREGERGYSVVMGYMPKATLPFITSHASALCLGNETGSQVSALMKA